MRPHILLVAMQMVLVFCQATLAEEHRSLSIPNGAKSGDRLIVAPVQMSLEMKVKGELRRFDFGLECRISFSPDTKGFELKDITDIAWSADDVDFLQDDGFSIRMRLTLRSLQEVCFYLKDGPLNYDWSEIRNNRVLPSVYCVDDFRNPKIVFKYIMTSTRQEVCVPVSLSFELVDSTNELSGTSRALTGLDAYYSVRVRQNERRFKSLQYSVYPEDSWSQIPELAKFLASFGSVLVLNFFELPIIGPLYQSYEVQLGGGWTNEKGRSIVSLNRELAFGKYVGDGLWQLDHPDAGARTFHDIGYVPSKASPYLRDPTQEEDTQFELSSMSILLDDEIIEFGDFPELLSPPIPEIWIYTPKSKRLFHFMLRAGDVPILH